MADGNEGRPMRALITRPEEDAAPLTEALTARNVEVAIEPLLMIRVLDDAAVDLDGVQALLFTSANGVRAFAARSERRDLGVLTVGDASAAAAREAGFGHVESATGDVGDLVRLVKRRLDPKGGALFHAAGSVVAGDLAGQLAEAGFTLRRVMLYEAKPAEALSPEVLAALAERTIDLVLFFSPRTAATFVELVRKAGDPRVTAGCASAAALCLSPAVAEAAGAITWKSLHSAARPDLPSMLRLIEEAIAPGSTSAEAPASGPAASVIPASSPPPEPTPPPAAPARSGGSMIAAAVVAAVVTVAGLASEPLWRPYLGGLIPAPEAPAVAPDPALVAGIDGLKGQTQELAQRLAALDGMIQQLDARGAGAVTDMTDLGTRLAALERDMAALRHDVAAVAATPSASAPAATSIPEDIAGLPEQVAALRQSLAEVAAKAASRAESGPLPEVADALDGLRRQVEALETSARGFDAWTGAIETRLAAAEAMEQRVAALEQAISTAETRSTGNVALALAINQLQSALATERPFAGELSAVQDVAAAYPLIAAKVGDAVATLAQHADTGVPTLIELRAEFPAVARAVVAAARAEHAATAVAEAAPGTGGGATQAPGWLDDAMLKLSELVSVRPVGEDVAGDDAAARVARAEAVLARSDLAGAVAELDGLGGEAAASAAPWLGDARARLDAETALAALQSLAVARLAPAGSGG